ncbi:MAG: hypothetical protein OIF48_15405 [Silicimonas sp.]|nr:hypothetical protein [Silicimonas sp.]
MTPVRVVLFVLVLALLLSGTWMALRGVGGESTSVISTRTGSPGGGYLLGGRGVK